MRVAGSGVERPAAGQSLPAGVAPEGAAKAAGPSVTAGRSPYRVEPGAKAPGGNPRFAGDRSFHRSYQALGGVAQEIDPVTYCGTD